MKRPNAKNDRKKFTMRNVDNTASLYFVKPLDIAQRIVDNSTATSAKNFDTSQWLSPWIEQPQPSLGGKRPAEVLESPTGVELVARVLLEAESGVYL